MDSQKPSYLAEDEYGRETSGTTTPSIDVDEEIQKLFEMPRTKFSLASIRDPSMPVIHDGGSQLRLEEHASAHRSETFPVIRAPLGPMMRNVTSKSRRRYRRPGDKTGRQPPRVESEPATFDMEDLLSDDQTASSGVSSPVNVQPNGLPSYLSSSAVKDYIDQDYDSVPEEDEPLLSRAADGKSMPHIVTGGRHGYGTKAKQVADSKHLVLDVGRSGRDKPNGTGLKVQPMPIRGVSPTAFGKLPGITEGVANGATTRDMLAPNASYTGVDWKIGSDDNTPRSTPYGGRSPTAGILAGPAPLTITAQHARVQYLRSHSVPSPSGDKKDDNPPVYRPGDDETPQVSQRAALAARDDRVDALRQQGVQFEVGSLTDVRDEAGKKGKHKPKSHRRAEEDPAWRMRAGSEVEPAFQQARLPTEVDEAVTLGQGDLDEMASHRYDHVKNRRHKNSHTLVISRKEGADMVPQLMRKSIDHEPKDCFVQLDELYVTLSGQEWEWKETARWIKYEEDVEEGGKWGKPHVASLSFHSLLNLRKCLEQGVVLLDLEADDIVGIVSRVVEQMVISDQIHPEQRGPVMRTLLLRHRSVDDNEAFFKVRRNATSCSLHNLNEKSGWPKLVPSLTNIASPSESVVGSVTNMNPNLAPTNLLSPNEATGYIRSGSFRFGSIASSYRDVESGRDSVVSAHGLRHVPSHSILKKIPVGSQASSIHVGAVDFLELPAVAFVRLAKGTVLPLTEVPIPTRFLFFLLGPLNTDLDYHEIGRAIGTLMSNGSFLEVAYKTETRKDLLCAINEFLDDSIVLPPGEWESKNLLPIEDLQAKSREIRERKKQRLEMERQLEEQPLVGKDEKILVPALSDGLKVAAAGDGEPPKNPDDPMVKSGPLFSGMIRDMKRRYPKYLSDFTDALNPVCLATAVFIYFAALSGAITFGGLYGAKTNNLIGVSETLVATCCVGILFSLLAGQPLIIVGATGPVLLFDQSLFSFCESQGVDFLSIRVWVGVWLAIIGIVITAFQGATLVRFFTRFTEEIFASLVSLLFIYESFYKLYSVFRDHPLLAEYCFSPTTTLSAYLTNATIGENVTYLMTTMSPAEAFENMTTLARVRRDVTGDAPEMTPVTISPDLFAGAPRGQPNTALMSTVLMLGTFLIAYFLRHFRNSHFLGRSARRALGDFGVPIAIVIMVVMDYLVEDTYTEKLSVPDGLSPSNAEVRGWFISPISDSLPIWMILACCLPALLVFILIFMETQICQLIINKKCKKGSGHHLDIFLLCVLNAFCAMCGAPWQPAATVRAVSHVSALTVWSTNQAPGEKPKILEVKEQRVTSLVVALLVGLSVLMAPVLKKVPLAVLFGVFLYMGVSSTNGIQFFERLQLLFMPVKHHPRVGYVRRVRTWKMHMFTLIQIACLVVLWVVKSSIAALAFPFVLLLMIPIRTLLGKFFTPRELMALDGKNDDTLDNEEEPDFFVQAHDIS